MPLEFYLSFTYKFIAQKKIWFTALSVVCSVVSLNNLPVSSWNWSVWSEGLWLSIHRSDYCRFLNCSCVEMGSTKSCWFLPKDEFHLRISHCSVKLWTIDCDSHNYSSACYRKLKWNIARSFLLLPLLYLVSPDPTSVTLCGRETSVEKEKKLKTLVFFFSFLINLMFFYGAQRSLLAQKTLKSNTSSAPLCQLHWFIRIRETKTVYTRQSLD